ncbi:MAG: hypothetical protein AAFR79_07960 [Pseudomonadota bacterium]
MELRGFVSGDRGAVSVEWIAVTAALMTVGVFVAYELMSGGVAPIREQVNNDFNRVQIQPEGG